jgi:hypothetical protein
MMPTQIIGKRIYIPIGRAGEVRIGFAKENVLRYGRI